MLNVHFGFNREGSFSQGMELMSRLQPPEVMISVLVIFLYVFVTPE